MKCSAKKDLPGLPEGFEYRLDLATAATPKDLKSAPRHRWFHFPHSYSYRLVHEVLNQWDLPERAVLADNFVGSGTTMLTARERGMHALGYDLSPLAVTVTNTKVRSYLPKKLKDHLEQILSEKHAELSSYNLPVRITKAFTQHEIQEIYGLLTSVFRLPRPARDFFLVSILSTGHRFSRAVSDGGWFRWKEWPDQAPKIRPYFETNTLNMIADIEIANWLDSPKPARARFADARKLPLPVRSVDGIITSPPYANRHDYSRVFHIDLLLLGQTESNVIGLRHRSVRSNVEAKVPSGYKKRLGAYSRPESLKDVIESLPSSADPRIKPLLNGYFEDMFLSLQEVGRILRPGGRVAYVVGNVRHAGVMVPVDAILGQLAPQAGLVFDSSWVLRLKGNSAQQMGLFGREPARESVVFMSRASND